MFAPAVNTDINIRHISNTSPIILQGNLDTTKLGHYKTWTLQNVGTTKLGHYKTWTLQNETNPVQDTHFMIIQEIKKYLIHNPF